MPGHCLAIMLAAWRGQSLVPASNVAGLERAFNPLRHPELAAREAEVDLLSGGSPFFTKSGLMPLPSGGA
jgi:hypothetical protein